MNRNVVLTALLCVVALPLAAQDTVTTTAVIRRARPSAPACAADSVFTARVDSLLAEQRQDIRRLGGLALVAGGVGVVMLAILVFRRERPEPKLPHEYGDKDHER